MEVLSRIEHLMTWGRANEYNMMVMGSHYKGVMMFEKEGHHFEIPMEQINEMELGDIALLIDRSYGELLKDDKRSVKWCTQCDEYEIDEEIEFIGDDMLKEVYDNYKEVEWFGQKAIEITLKQLMLWERFCRVNGVEV